MISMSHFNLFTTRRLSCLQTDFPHITYHCFPATAIDIVIFTLDRKWWETIVKRLMRSSLVLAVNNNISSMLVIIKLTVNYYIGWTMWQQSPELKGIHSSQRSLFPRHTNCSYKAQAEYLNTCSVCCLAITFCLISTEAPDACRCEKPQWKIGRASCRERVYDDV